LINRELKVCLLGHEKDGSVYGIDGVRCDKSRETFRRAVTRSKNILLKRLLKDVEIGRKCQNRVLVRTLGMEQG
jgi:hypothetical protein